MYSSIYRMVTVVFVCVCVFVFMPSASILSAKKNTTNCPPHLGDKITLSKETTA